MSGARLRAPRNQPDPTRHALRELERALAGREDHKPWVGVKVIPTYFGTRLDWRDALTSEQGLIALVPRRRAAEPTVAAVFEKLKEWRT